MKQIIYNPIVFIIVIAFVGILLFQTPTQSCPIGYTLTNNVCILNNITVTPAPTPNITPTATLDPKVAYLSVSSNPTGASINLDNGLYGITNRDGSNSVPREPGSYIRYIPGTFVLKVSKAGYATITDTVTLTAGTVTLKNYLLIPETTVAPTNTPIPTPAINLISNPTFSSVLTPWEFAGSGTPSLVNGEYSVLISAANTANQISISGINLKPSTKYTLKFDIYGINPQKVTTRIIKHTTPYTPYAPDYTFTPTTTKTTHTVSFMSSSTASNDARLMFYLGMATAWNTYKIDNIILTEG